MSGATSTHLTSCGSEAKISEQYSTAKYGGNSAGGRSVYHEAQKEIWAKVDNAGSSGQGRLTPHLIIARRFGTCVSVENLPWSSAGEGE
jgi:hypothetical protein